MATRTIEALIGMALLFGTLFSAYSFLPQSPRQVNTREFGESVLEALAFDQNFRSMVAGTDSNDLSGIRNEISKQFQGQFLLQVCGNQDCYGQPASGTRYVTANYLYEGNSTNYSPKTVYLHMVSLK